MFDPDYRTKGWNKSRFAPKNSKNARKGKKHTPITDIAMGMGALMFMVSYLAITELNLLPSDALWQLGGAGASGMVMYMFTGIYILSREASRVRGDVEPKKKPDNTVERTKPGKRRKEESREFRRPANINRDAGSPIVGSHSTITAQEFEEQIAWLINATTRYRAEVVGGSGDGGVDIKIYGDKRKLVGIVQCKRYKPDKPLAPMHIRALAGVKRRMKVDIAYLATTAYFTDDAQREAEELDIRLLDGDKIRNMVYRTSRRFMQSGHAD